MREHSPYFKLPSLRRQIIIILLALISYGAWLYGVNTLFPEIPDALKKRLAQAGIVILYIASLTAGLGFVWAAKARHNDRLASEALEKLPGAIALDEQQMVALNIDFSAQIARMKKELDEARQQKCHIERMPDFYEKCGAISLVLVAVGTMLCFVGAG